MKRFPIVLLAVLLTTALAAGGSFAADEPTANVEPPKMEVVTEAPAACDSGLDLPSFLVAPTEASNEDASSLTCNCNRNEDCKRICGNEGGNCFIGPVCDNWPDFTGKCMCAKQGEPQEL